MASKAFHVAAILCAVLGCVLLIAAMASSAWMIACMKYDKIIDIAKSSMPEVMNTPQYKAGAQMLSGMDFCVSEGLFKLTMNAGNLVHMSFGIDIGSIPKSAAFGAAAMVLGVLSGVVGGIFLTVAASGDPESYEGKSKISQRTRTGMIILVVAGLVTMGGMAVYTAGSATSIHNPMQFLATMGKGMSTMFGGANSPFGRGKRDLSSSFSSIGGGSAEQLESIINGLGMDPMYGYAFYIAWVSAIAFFIGAVLAAVAKQSVIGQPYAGSNSVKL